jgi:hypothetical protein
MKLGQFYVLIGSIFTAPLLSPNVAIIAASIYMALGLWLTVRRKDSE